ncbi:MAG: TrmH family RNA methyltransferase [Flavobacteriales bacterium]
MNVLFFATEYRPNLSNMIRTAEFFGLKKIYVYDQNNLLKPPTNKVSKAEMEHMAKVWTAGAIDFIEIISLDDTAVFLKEYKGRIIATLLDKSAPSLQNFTFQKNDLLIMGSEKEGLPLEVVALCDQKLYIEQRGHTNCLNISTAFGIFLNKMIEDIDTI